MHPEKSCRGCTMCCRLVAVTELKKPALRTCDHARCGEGCAAYAERPPSCQLYECMWLRAEPRLFGDQFHPETCHVLFEDTCQGLMARCDPVWPDAWRTGDVASFLSLHAKNGNPVYVMCGRQMYVVGALGACAIPKHWVVDSNDGMRQHFTIPNEVLRKVGWGPFRFLDKMRNKWH